MIIGGVGELRPARHVADGIDATVGRAQALVDDNTGTPEADAGSLEPEAFNDRTPAGRDQDMAGVDRFFAGRRLQHGPDSGSRRVHARHGDAGANIDLLAGQPVEDDGGALGIVLCERHGGLQNGDLRTEPPECLRELETDRPRADDQQMARAFGEVEHRLVGEVGQPVEPRDRRHRRL